MIKISNDRLSLFKDNGIRNQLGSILLINHKLQILVIDLEVVQQYHLINKILNKQKNRIIN